MTRAQSPKCAHARQAVIVCCDDNHLPYASAVLLSVYEHNEPLQFDLILCSDQDLILPCKLREIGVKFLRLQDGVAAGKFKLTRLPLQAYLRLWLPAMLEGEYDRVLYLDTDVLVQGGDIGKLFNIDLLGHPVAAVLERPMWGFPKHLAKDFKAFGLPCAPYFNSGVMLFDVEKYLDQKILEACLDLAERSHDKFHYHDQSLLNICLYRNWLELSPHWNWQWLSRLPLYEPIFNPFLLHMYGKNKPWCDMEGQLPLRIKTEYVRLLRELSCAQGRGVNVERDYIFGRFAFARLVWRHLRHLKGFRRYAARFSSPYSGLSTREHQISQDPSGNSLQRSNTFGCVGW